MNYRGYAVYGQVGRIKAIPTRYAGVRFRSRLEARWAAFFDLAKWEWSYEPIDFVGWVPDFRLRFQIDGDPFPVRVVSVFVEVKPVETQPWLNSYALLPGTVENKRAYAKAIAYTDYVQVLLLGLEPGYSHLGALLEPPKKPETHYFRWQIEQLLMGLNLRHSIYEEPICLFDPAELWVEAGNVVQWRAPS
jgi:hypothetical protein